MRSMLRRHQKMTNTAYFLLKTDIGKLELADAAKEVEKQSQAECIDYMLFNNTEAEPYITWDFPLY